MAVLSQAWPAPFQDFLPLLKLQALLHVHARDGAYCWPDAKTCSRYSACSRFNQTDSQETRQQTHLQFQNSAQAHINRRSRYTKRHPACATYQQTRQSRFWRKRPCIDHDDPYTLILFNHIPAQKSQGPQSLLLGPPCGTTQSGER